jgi:hypothetical protein
MSWTALAWASKQKTGSSNSKLVLLMLANFANEKNECYPSFKKLCELTELSRATVIRCIKVLEQGGMIERKERFTQFEGGNRQTSNLYLLKLALEGYQAETHEYHTDTPPSIIVTPHITSNKEPNMYEEDFELFWKEYPRNDGSKKKAYDNWKKVTKKIIDKQELFKLCREYGKIHRGKDVKFVPHCTTWLNQQRWETVEKEKTREFNKNQLVG